MTHRRRFGKKREEISEGREEITYRSKLCEVRKAKKFEVGA